MHDLYIRDIYQGHDGNVSVHVENGKGGRPREVQALPGHNEDVWTMREGHPDNEKVFERIHATWMSIPFDVNLHRRSTNTMPMVETYPHRPDASDDKTTIALQRNG